MVDSVVDQMSEIAQDVSYIRQMLEGDDFSEGMLHQVKKNTAEIAAMKKDDESQGYNRGTLIGLSWLFMSLALLVTIIDRSVLISDIRDLLPLTTLQAAAISTTMGLSAKALVSIPITIFVYSMAMKRN